MPTLLFHPLRNEQGASLVEVLLVIAILGGLAGVFSLAASRNLRNELDQARFAIDRLVRNAKHGALEVQEPIVLEFVDRIFSVHSIVRTEFSYQSRFRVPDAISIRVLSAQEFGDNRTARFLFLPDGRSSGGSIEISIRGRSQVLDIDSQTSSLREAVR